MLSLGRILISDLVATNLFIHVLSGMILLYLAAPFQVFLDEIIKLKLSHLSMLLNRIPGLKYGYIYNAKPTYVTESITVQNLLKLSLVLVVSCAAKEHFYYFQDNVIKLHLLVCIS